MSSKRRSVLSDFGAPSGKPHADSSSVTRATESWRNHPSRADMLAAITMPAPTASPCSHSPCPSPVSMACPKVCPKFSNARSPCSRSSAATTSALFWHARITASLIAAASRAKMDFAFVSIQSKKSGSRIKPYLMVSATPHRNSRSSSVVSVSLSLITHTG